MAVFGQSFLLQNDNRYRYIMTYTRIGYHILYKVAKMIVYDNLWETMREKGITQYALIKKYGVSPAQITRLKRGESVSTNTIDMFCKILQCRVEDIMEHKSDI